MYTGILHTHVLSVALFLLLYIVKTYLLASGKHIALDKVSKATKHPERLISVLFLATGIYLLMNLVEVPTIVYIKIAMVFASIPLAVIGFKRKKPILAIVSVVLLILSFGLAIMKDESNSNNNPKTEISQQASEAEVGKALYENNCQKCHGAGGDAGGFDAKNLKLTKLNLEEQASIISNGKGGMPGFKNLKSNEVQAIVKHVQSLK